MFVSIRDVIALETGFDSLHEALTFYDRCLAADPAYSYAYYHKARSLEALGRPADAIAALRAGETAARNCGDDHALSEISAYLDALSP